MRDMRLFRLLVVKNAFGPGVDILDANNGGHFAYSIERFKGCFGFAHVAFNRFMRHVDERAGFPVFAFCLADMGNGNAACDNTYKTVLKDTSIETGFAFMLQDAESPITVYAYDGFMSNSPYQVQEIAIK